MQQATSTLPRLFSDYQAATAEKRRVYALVDDAVDVDPAEAICDAAYDAVEAIADVILASPVGSAADAAIKASVLMARGAGAAEMIDYRPDDLSRFVQEVRDLAFPR